MSMSQALRRKGMVGVFAKISHHYWLFKTRVYLRPQFARIGRGTSIRKPLLIGNPRGITVGSDTMIRDRSRLEVVDRPGEKPGRLIIGDNVSMEQNAHIAACGIISIGDDVCLAANVSILDTSHPAGLPGEGNRVRTIESGPAQVTLGRRVFIGTGATVLRNVTIGDNAIIGAGSVVTHDIPANSVAVGSPARVIKTLPTGPSSG